MPESYLKFNDIYIVTDLMETDLHNIIKSEAILSEKHIVYFVYQILLGLKHMHDSGVMH